MLHSYNNSVRTKVNALNLISVVVIFIGDVMQVRGGGNVEVGGSRSGERLVVNGGSRTEAKLITGLCKFDVMSHFP